MQLNEAQEHAVTAPVGPLLVLAGAGSGKTRVLTERVAHLIESGAARPSEILAITFTNKAAAEMRQRILSRLGLTAESIWIMTFHKASLLILRREITLLGYPQNFVVYDSQDQAAVVRSVVRDLSLDEKRYTPGAMLARISEAKNDMRTPQDVERGGGYYEQQVARVFEAYQRRLQQMAALDFDDLIGHCVRLWSDYPEVRSRWQQRFRHLLVDEYQDTNLCQYRWIRLLAGDDPSLMVVGDPDQSIYGWRGADIRNILEFEQDFKGARTILLNENYRSTGTILKVANAIVANNVMRREKNLFTQGGDGAPVTLIEARDDTEEADIVAREIRRLKRHEKQSLTEVAILTRTNAQSRPLEEALIRQGLPYRLIGGVRFYERQEIKDMLAYLRVVSNPLDEISLQRIINMPRRGIGDTTLGLLRRLAQDTGRSLLDAMRSAGETLPIRSRAPVETFSRLMDELQQVAKEIGLARLIEEISTRSGYLDMLRAEPGVESESRYENIMELVAKAREAEREGDDMNEFLARVALLTDLDAATEDGERLSVMTLHAAKGLEFDVVFLTGLEEGLLPHSRSLEGGEEPIEEERRLFYVGITRARRKLYMARAMRRSMRGETLPSVASRFWLEVPETYTRPWRASGMPVVQGERSDGGLVEGQRVRHPLFGPGTVIAVHGDGDDDEVTVAFAGHGVKRLVRRYAALRAMGGD